MEAHRINFEGPTLEILPPKKVFISWSGDDEQEIALKLKEFLVKFYNVDVFVSSKDIRGIDEGWRVSINNNLKTADYGIVLVSSQNSHAPWLLYEAGALDGHLNFQNVSVVALDIPVEGIPSPLKGKQVRKLTYEDFEKLRADFQAAGWGCKTNSSYRGKKSWNSFAKSIQSSLQKLESKANATMATDAQTENNGVSSRELLIQSGKVIKPYVPGKSISKGGYIFPVKFDKPFAERPSVVCSLCMADSASPIDVRSKNSSLSFCTTRINVEAVEITKVGFNLRTTTWNDNVLHGVGVSWIAYGKSAD